MRNLRVSLYILLTLSLCSPFCTANVGWNRLHLQGVPVAILSSAVADESIRRLGFSSWSDLYSPFSSVSASVKVCFRTFIVFQFS